MPTSKGKKKKGPSGYMKFVQEHYKEVEKENPGLSFGEIGKTLGKMWRELSEEEKEEYY